MPCSCCRRPDILEREPTVRQQNGLPASNPVLNGLPVFLRGRMISDRCALVTRPARKEQGRLWGELAKAACAARRDRITPRAFADFTEFLKDQPYSCLHFFVRIQNHFSSRPASQPHGQPLAQFSPLGFVSCSGLHPLF